MAKRLTDVGKWDKVWFRKLDPIHKCFWLYVCDRCDYAGIWEVDFETAGHYIGQVLEPNIIKPLFSKQYIELNGGSRWILKDFIIFQYGNFNEQNKMFFPIKNTLERHGVSMGDIWGIHARKVTVKDKVKDTVKGVENFEEVWALYPEKVGRKEAQRHFEASVKTDKDLVDIKIAIENYKQSDRVKKGYIQNGSTFFNDWQGWVNYKPVLNQEAEYDKLLQKAGLKNDNSSPRKR